MQTLTPHENIYTLPNFLTFSRLLAAPVIGYLVIHQQHAWAVGLFAYAGITDLIDGWIARRWKLQTVVGSVVDPMADKALMTVLVGCLAATGGLPRKSLFLIAADIAHTLDSVASSYHIWTRYVTRIRSDLLSLRIPTTTENLYAVLGLFYSLGRSTPNHSLKAQHFPPVDLDWFHAGVTSPYRQYDPGLVDKRRRLQCRSLLPICSCGDYALEWCKLCLVERCCSYTGGG